MKIKSCLLLKCQCARRDIRTLNRKGPCARTLSMRSWKIIKPFMGLTFGFLRWIFARKATQKNLALLMPGSSPSHPRMPACGEIISMLVVFFQCKLLKGRQAGGLAGRQFVRSGGHVGVSRCRSPLPRLRFFIDLEQTLQGSGPKIPDKLRDISHTTW